VENDTSHWWDTVIRLSEGAIAATAAAASSAAGWMFYRYKHDRAKLLEHDKYIRSLRRRRVLTKTMEHAKLLANIERRLADTSKLADQLDDQIKAMANVAMSLQGSVTNLTALVETRGKEHHQLRDFLQPIVSRLDVLETMMGLKGARGQSGIDQ
jgi:hypothetical protein